MDDMALLREYASRQSETAFTTLVERHIGLVYCAALRQARDPALAQEITQVVFILLARKAPTFGHGIILSAWLYRTARFAAADARKTAFRRQQREHEAAQMQTTSADESAWEKIAPLLDEALAALAEKDRVAVMLRFFEQKSLEEVGMALGIGPGTAQKRVWRAVDKLRQYFSLHGAALSTGALTAALTTHATQGAPAGLAATVAATAALKGTAASASTATLLKTTLKLMAWTKAKITAIAIVGVLLAAATTTITVKEIQEHRTYPWQDLTDGSAEKLRVLDATPPQVTLVRSRFATNVPDGRLVADLGPANGWRYLGIHESPGNIVDVAFDNRSHLPAEIFLPSNMPGCFYDYIANLPHGSQNALQELVKKKFGLVGKHEMREMDVLLLRVDHPNAPGLKPGTVPPPGNWGSPVIEGKVHCQNISMSRFAGHLEVALGIPVVDQTGLAGNYDVEIPVNFGATFEERMETARTVLQDEFGMKLVPARQPHEAFIVENVK